MNTTQHILDYFYQNDEWLYWADVVSQFTSEDDPKFGSDHGISHWARVSIIATEFAEKTGSSDHEINLVTIAGLLHDCGITNGEKGHAQNGAVVARSFLQKYLHELPVSLCEVDIGTICDAIAKHSTCDSINNIVDAALMFADKIDIAQHRVLHVCNEIQRSASQIQYIHYALSNRELSIQYVTDPEFDYVFFLSSWPKAYCVPARVATWLNRDFRFFVNGEHIVLPS